jgi:hypothetical protein
MFAMRETFRQLPNLGWIPASAFATPASAGDVKVRGNDREDAGVMTIHYLANLGKPAYTGSHK